MDDDRKPEQNSEDDAKKAAVEKDTEKLDKPGVKLGAKEQ
jgi:hypothetical protein